MKQEITTQHKENCGAGKFRLYTTAALWLMAGVAVGYIAGSLRNRLTIDIRGVAAPKELS